MKCTKAPAMEAALPNSGSAYATEGTTAHAVAALIVQSRYSLKGNLVNEAYGPTALEAFEGSTPEMLDGAMELCALIDEIREMDGGIELLATEQKLNLGEWVPSGWGTADIILASPTDLYVIDYKYGQGVQVSAESNEQLRLYGLGALKYSRDMGLEGTQRVRMCICQPRAGGSSSETLTAKQLLGWGDTVVAPKAQTAYTGEGAEFEPGESACRFCRARRICRARAEKSREAVRLKGIRADTLSTAEIAEMLIAAQGAKQWIADLEAELADRLEAGEEAEGWAMLPGRSTRHFLPEAELVAKGNGIELWDKKPKSPFTIEKELGKAKFRELFGDCTKAVPGKPSLKRTGE
jgi:hypothetical protein